MPDRPSPAVAAPRRGRFAAATLVVVLTLGGVSSSVRAAEQGTRSALPALPTAVHMVLARYLAAVKARRFDVAFSLLTPDERRYFGDGSNYGSIFRADALRLERSAILGGERRGADYVATVDETTRYRDLAHGGDGEADGRVLYGVVAQPGGTYAIKDPFHPWRALAPNGIAVADGGFGITVRKVSFFTGRIELVVGFENRGDVPVTVLLNRTVVRDDRGNVLHAAIDPGVVFTDRELRRGLRLPANARYTGAIAFPTADRYRPRTVTLTVGPMLRDGGDRPFSLDLPAIAIGG